MQKAGGIVALVGGSLGMVAAIVTLLFGVLDGEIMGAGLSGLIFSVATIVLGAVAIGAEKKDRSFAGSPRQRGALLIVCAVLGAVFGGGIRRHLHGAGADRGHSRDHRRVQGVQGGPASMKRTMLCASALACVAVFAADENTREVDVAKHAKANPLAKALLTQRA